MSSPAWDEFVELALKRITASGAEYGDIRIQDSTTEHIEGEDQRIASIRDVRDIGFGVRVLYHGAWGFAASSVVSLEEVPRVADLAVEIAKGSASVALEKVRLAPEPVHRDRVVTPYRIDPLSVPLEKKTDLLLNTMETLQRQSGIARSSASLWARRDKKLFVSTEGSRLEFDLLAGQGECTATALYEGRFASRSFNTPAAVRDDVREVEGRRVVAQGQVGAVEAERHRSRHSPPRRSGRHRAHLQRVLDRVQSKRHAAAAHGGPAAGALGASYLAPCPPAPAHSRHGGCVDAPPFRYEAGSRAVRCRCILARG